MSNDFSIHRLPGRGRWYAIVGRGLQWTRPAKTVRELMPALAILRQIVADEVQS